MSYQEGEPGKGQRKVVFGCLPIVSGGLWLDLTDIKGLEEFGPNSASCLSHLRSTYHNLIICKYFNNSTLLMSCKHHKKQCI